MVNAFSLDISISSAFRGTRVFPEREARRPKPKARNCASYITRKNDKFNSLTRPLAHASPSHTHLQQTTCIRLERAHHETSLTLPSLHLSTSAGRGGTS